MKDPLFLHVQKLLKLNSIPFDKAELEFQIQSHPSYPSLHAITGVLDHFDINNIALDVPQTAEVLEQLPISFLAQTKTDKGLDFSVVKKREHRLDIFKPNSKKKETIKADIFLEQFTGIIVAVEKEDNNESLTDRTTLIQNVAFVTSISLFVAVFILLKPSLSNSIFTLLSIVGVLLSFTIYKQEQGETTVIGNAFCSGDTKSKSCDDVINSKGAQVFKNFKLSDLSIVYFSALTLSAFILNASQATSAILYLITFASVPITIFSIYYQSQIVKKWCALCLSIIAVLWLQVGVSGFNINFILEFSLSNTMVTLFSFTVSFVIWNYIKRLLKDKQEFKRLRIEHSKFKRNFNLFEGVLNKSKQISIPQNLFKIVLGNPNSQLELTVITNPFCGHCKAVHFMVEDLLKKTHDIKINILFNIKTKDVTSEIVKITSRLLELYNTVSQDILLNAMDEIYSDRDGTKWLEKWGNCSNESHYFEVLKQQTEWCQNNDINFTPELLINGKSFPSEYKREDLVLFIEDLQESIKVTNTITPVQV